MSELTLSYKDPDGEERSVSVEGTRFTIGRHSKNELTITDSRLSREHLLIENEGGRFVVSDLGSSNGTLLNGKKLEGRSSIEDGDKLNLGGFEIDCLLESSGADDSTPATASEPDQAGGPDADPEEAPLENAPAASPPSAAPAQGLSPAIFFIAPVAALVVLGTVIAFIYVAGGQSEQPGNSNFIYSHDDDEPTGNKRISDPGDTPSNGTASTTPSNSKASGSPSPSGTVSETARIENNAATFLRAAAQNDPKAFITGEQAKIVEDRIDKLSRSAAISANLDSARRSAAELKALAASKNLKPQFLAAAALAKLGTSRGDVMATARSMADVLDRLGTQVGSELGDDCLLMIAAYDQGAAGDFMRMRNMLQDLATKFPESSRAIRTIWFLKKNNKITDGEYDLAITFLAVGTIAQGPRDFGVNAERLEF